MRGVDDGLDLGNIASRQNPRACCGDGRVNERTIWTWVAMASARAHGNLMKMPEAKKGFLLNHLIHELLPASKTACVGLIPAQSLGRPLDSICRYDRKTGADEPAGLTAI